MSILGKKVTWPILAFLFSVAAIKAWLTLKSGLALDFQQIDASYVSKSLSLLFSSDKANFFDYLRNQGYLLFPLQIIALLPSVLLLSSPLLTVRFPALILEFFLILLLVLVFSGGQKKAPLFLLLVVVAVFSFSPWLTQLSAFHLPELLSVVLIFSSVLLLRGVTLSRNRLILVLLLLLFSALSSWTGFFYALALPVFLGVWLWKNKMEPPRAQRLGVSSQERKIPPGGGKAAFLAHSSPRTETRGILRCEITHLRTFLLLSLVLLYVPLALTFWQSRQYISSSLSSETLFAELRPEKLGEEINQTQKAYFLATNQQFVLPTLARKFLLNKPLLATKKAMLAGIELFDFEQFASTINARDITRASGLPPKGLAPLTHLWEIPLFFLGAYLLLRRRKHLLLYLFLPAFLAAIIFEKRFLAASGAALLPFLLIFEAEALVFLTRNLEKAKPVIKSSIVVLAALVFTVGTIHFNYLLFFNQFQYRNSHPYLFQEIASFLGENKSNYERIVVTNRFGPTSLATAYYLGFAPKEFWPKYLSPESVVLGEETAQLVSFENLEFRPIKISLEGTTSRAAYLAFPGELVGPGQEPKSQKTDPRVVTLDKIDVPDQIVTDMGKGIWIVRF